jgi:ABC-2 type transport system permease protein
VQILSTLIPADREAAASSTILLPYLSSAFVPTDTMPGWLQAFTGTPIGSNAVIAVGWCLGIALLGYAWAQSAFRRRKV